jgi:DNA-binding transcriptional LysR family regulator
MDVELWQLRYVIAVADELNFTRAAARLHISQPALSTRIRELEARLGVALFERTSRRVSVTPAGALLAERGRALLEDAASAVAAARNAATAAPVLRVGVLGTSGAVLFPLVAERVAALQPQAVLEPRQLARPDDVDGTIDVAFTRLEHDESDLQLAPLLRERRVVALGARHPLAGRDEVRLADLAGESFLTQRLDSNPRFRERWLEEQRRAGLDGRISQEVVNAEELFALLTAGRGVCLVPATAARYYARPGLAYVAVADADSVPIALAWRAGADQPLLRLVVDAAREVAAELLAAPGQTDWLPPAPSQGHRPRPSAAG